MCGLEIISLLFAVVIVVVNVVVVRRCGKFSSDLIGDEMMMLGFDQRAERRDLPDTEIILVLLNKDEERLVPDDGHDDVGGIELTEVSDETLDNTVGQGILLVEEDADEKTIRAGILHLREFHQRS